MDNDVTTIQRARGWRECEYEDENWHQPETALCVLEVYEEGESCCRYGWYAPYPDPLADTPEGWCEFGQILKWAHEKGWRFEMDHHAGNYQVSVWVVDHWGSLSEGHHDFRASIVEVLAEAVRRTSNRSEG